MPVCIIQTNLPADQVPHDLAVKFSKALAEILTKPEEVGLIYMFVSIKLK